MALRIVWSESALADRREIIRFWRKHTGSPGYPARLDSKFRDAIQLLAEFPEIGRAVEGRPERCFRVESFLILYRRRADELQIVRIWDVRRNPDLLEF